VRPDVLILGCGRSGTSIFWELFDGLPGYRGASEPTVGELRQLPRDLPLAVKVPRPHPAHPAPPGSPLPMEVLDEVVPEPRVVFWQVRHPLDAVASLRVGISRGWAHHPRPPDWERWLDRSLVERCAHHWATVNGPGYDEVRRVAVINRFEDMIEDPLGCARRAVAVAGRDPDGLADVLAAWADRVRDTDDERFVEARTSRRHSRADHTRRVGRWTENLTTRDVEAVVPIVAEAAAKVGYELPGSP
jgi:hypothetical protein